MLQIRLNKPPSVKDGAAASAPKPIPLDTVTVACPDHLVIADLPVAKSLGVIPSAPLLKNIGRKSRCLIGERVHFCLRCDFPIAVYGRLISCGHAFCLDCARTDSVCYLCEERIRKIQTIKMMEGIFICGAAHCFKSFLKKTEFNSHILENHRDLLQPNADKEERKDSEVGRSSKLTQSDSTVQMSIRPAFSPSSNAQSNDMSRHQQALELQLPGAFFQQRPQGPPLFFGHIPNLLPQPQVEFPALHVQQPPNYPMLVNSNNLVPHHPSLPYPSYPAQDSHPFYKTHYEILPPPIPSTDAGSGQGSVHGFPMGQPISTLSMDNHNLVIASGNAASQQPFHCSPPIPTPHMG
uniref:RING-type E3 ubiquitin transferase n=1 Tax=Kalanchoe fedtschenkoi TaxID=63787 RepID=A0A7N0ZY57_KALFE